MNPHKHHIIPRHKGGDDSPGNLMLVDPLRHAEIHALRFLEGEDNWFCAMQPGWPLLDPRLQDDVKRKMSSDNIMKNPEVAAKAAETCRERGVYEKHRRRMIENNPMRNPKVASKVANSKKKKESPAAGKE